MPSATTRGTRETSESFMNKMPHFFLALGPYPSFARKQVQRQRKDRNYRQELPTILNLGEVLKNNTAKTYPVYQYTPVGSIYTIRSSHSGAQ